VITFFLFFATKLLQNNFVQGSEPNLPFTMVTHLRFFDYFIRLEIMCLLFAAIFCFYVILEKKSTTKKKNRTV